jgi:hypothetical protein
VRESPLRAKQKRPLKISAAYSQFQIHLWFVFPAKAGIQLNGLDTSSTLFPFSRRVRGQESPMNLEFALEASEAVSSAS